MGESIIEGKVSFVRPLLLQGVPEEDDVESPDLLFNVTHPGWEILRLRYRVVFQVFGDIYTNKCRFHDFEGRRFLSVNRKNMFNVGWPGFCRFSLTPSRWTLSLNGWNLDILETRLLCGLSSAKVNFAQRPTSNYSLRAKVILSPPSNGVYTYTRPENNNSRNVTSGWSVSCCFSILNLKIFVANCVVFRN